MILAEEYKSKLVTPEVAVKAIKSGDWVEYGTFFGQPVALDKALAERKEELRDVKIRATGRLGFTETVKIDPSASHFTYNNWHFTGFDRKLHDQGVCWYVPMLFHEVPGVYRKYLDVDVVMFTTTPMDEHGYFNLGPQASYAQAALEKAKIIILEVNSNMPRCLGGQEEAIHISKVDYVVEADMSLPQLKVPLPTEIDNKIASLVLNEIEDGSCIQIGIGGMPSAVGSMIAQSDLRDLGIHTEMFVDAMVDMVEAGRVTGARKNIDKNKIVYTFAAGTNITNEFLHNNPSCAIYPCDYTNDPFIIAQNDKVISVNNCVEVDLFGQVCSESIGTRHITGTGGQVDWVYGSYRSKGGKSFICMTSTYKKGDEVRSRINPILTPGAIVTTHRGMTNYIVTEYGMVNLKGKSTWERAEALISIAHPDFRDELIKSAEDMGIWRQRNKNR